VLLGAVRLAAIAATEPVRRWVRAALPLLGLLPVLAYDVYVFFGSDQFASFRRGGAFPPRLDFVPALGPAAALAVASLRRPVADSATAARAHLWAWAAVAAAVAVSARGDFALQFLVGAGLPVLVLGAAALSSVRPRWTVLAAIALSTSAIVATRVALAEDPNWFVPRERLATGLALRELCRPGDPCSRRRIGLYASACRPATQSSPTPRHPATRCASTRRARSTTRWPRPPAPISGPPSRHAHRRAGRRRGAPGRVAGGGHAVAATARMAASPRSQSTRGRKLPPPARHPTSK
jgi:hypothetical protein